THMFDYVYSSHYYCSYSSSATTSIYTLSLHDALPIFLEIAKNENSRTLDHSTVLEIAKIQISGTLDHSTVLEIAKNENSGTVERSEEHTSELQSRFDLVCRLLLEKKNKKRI